MLSPTVSVSATEGSTTTINPEQPSTRRRGLSYLRALSHSSSAINAEQPRVSPRHFFQRSSSYNTDTKSRPTTARRRSASRPNESTGSDADRSALVRVFSAGNSPVRSTPDIPPFEENRIGSREERVPEESQTQATDDTDEMTRSRPSSRRAADGALPSPTVPSRPTAVRTGSSDDTNGAAGTNGTEETKTQAPTIRLFPHQDFRNGRQSLNFAQISRTLPSEGSIIRVGRYSEREGPPVANPVSPSDAPVGFKSKVVSRKHCEFSFVDGQWQIRDVASSSGTFLNHIRLSQPNQESRLFPVKDGDIVQLGIDFRGGEEMIFRCVKIRIECNRSWQKKPNAFNKTRRAQLLGLTKDQPASGQNSGECSICLGSILPCQALFVAPCAHVWHYKCIRPMLEGRQSQYPQFQCPNCRAWADLEADVDIAEEEMDDWIKTTVDSDDQLDADQTDRPGNSESAAIHENATTDTEGSQVFLEAPPADAPSNHSAVTVGGGGGLLARRAANNSEPNSTAVNGIPMPGRPNQEEIETQLAQQKTRTESPNGDQIIAGEGPLTPRNNAGPFVFDGSGGSGNSRRLAVPGLQEITEGRQL